MYEIVFSHRFKKMREKLLKSGSYNDSLLKTVTGHLATGKKLDQKLHDHELSGNMSGYREFHLSGDLVVVYEIDQRLGYVTLTAIGNHANLFE